MVEVKLLVNNFDIMIYISIMSSGCQSLPLGLQELTAMAGDL